jgi:hypothetical protein
MKNMAAEIWIGHSVVQGYGVKFAILKYPCPVDFSTADGGALKKKKTSRLNGMPSKASTFFTHHND